MKKNLLLLGIVILLAIIPLFMQKGAEFGGADGQAEELIGEINSSYEPWFSNIWEPPSGEIESLLFALQAAIGSGFIGYFVGWTRGKNRTTEKDKNKTNAAHR
ncbi:energy-coupling factor ABC transporter substrate-binding protein [Bacillus benzoevorans]|uniref:Cobalt transport protein CbiN n=1 Tax=Bacillus benzoevorans TaxID=1456 RepID=A0A7X0HQX9_9BACI|nr:energy-coupling factor ABC transporter substrate-binding protein [Bacillus benzoevorans]MBB6443931.1 cobalt/nickel transport protein [Bacillus benzoevorans]